MHFQREIPTVPQDYRMELGPLCERRRELKRRIGWSVIMAKAFAAVARDYAELRQTFLPWPFGRIHLHPHSVAMVALTREFEGENWLLFAPLVRPEEQPLAKLQRRIDSYRSSPVEVRFKQQLRLARMPWLVRRALWWCRIHGRGAKRVKRLGTFGLTSVGSKGVSIRHPIAPVPYVLTYGPFDESGRVRATIVYDHRLVDGSRVADALLDMERVLQGPLLAELKTRPSASHVRVAW